MVQVNVETDKNWSKLTFEEPNVAGGKYEQRLTYGAVNVEND